MWVLPSTSVAASGFWDIEVWRALAAAIDSGLSLRTSRTRAVVSARLRSVADMGPKGAYGQSAHPDLCSRPSRNAEVRHVPPRQESPIYGPHGGRSGGAWAYDGQAMSVMVDSSRPIRSRADQQALVLCVRGVRRDPGNGLAGVERAAGTGNCGRPGRHREGSARLLQLSHPGFGHRPRHCTRGQPLRHSPPGCASTTTPGNPQANVRPMSRDTRDLPTETRVLNPDTLRPHLA